MGTVFAVAVPVGVYIALIYLIYGMLVRSWDVLHFWLLALTAAVLVIAVLLAWVGVSMAICLLVVTLAPAVTVVGFEVTRPSARRAGSCETHRRHQLAARLSPSRRSPAASAPARPSSGREPSCG